MSVGGVSAGAQSIAAVNDLLKNVTAQTTDSAEKLMKYTVAASVGAEVGKGGAVDVTA